jgi:hypothetical protein
MDIGSRAPHNLGAARIRSNCWSGMAVHCIRQQLLPGSAWHQLVCDRPTSEAPRSARAHGCNAVKWGT